MFLNQNLFQQLTRPNTDLECREYVQLKRNIYSADIFNLHLKKSTANWTTRKPTSGPIRGRCGELRIIR